MPINPDDFLKPPSPEPDDALVQEFEEYVDDVVDNLLTKTQQEIELALKEISSNSDMRTHFGERLMPRFGREVRERLARLRRHR